MTSVYDLYLGDIATMQGYRCKSFMRDSAPLVAPKFSSGAAGQTDLDLLKSRSIDNLAGGMFQRTHTDPQKAARVVGFYNSFDEKLYPTQPATLTTAGGAGTVYCKAESGGYAFVNNFQFSGGFYYNIITKYVGNAITNIGGSMPAALNGSAVSTVILSMCLHKGYLFVASSTANMYRLNIAAGTWQDITAVSAVMFTLRGGLYCINSISGLYSVTNEFAAGAATYTKITDVGGSDLAPNEAVEFNGAAWITKGDGIYRFDGLSCIKVLSLNAQKLNVWNGALWFMVGQWLYRFDGTNVQKIQYFTDTIYQITSSSQYLFFQTWVTTSYIDSPKVPSGAGFARIYAYDGVAFSIALERDMTIESAISHACVCTGTYLIYAQANYSGTAWDNNNCYIVNLDNIFSSSTITTASQIDITSSEDDDDFPNIYKALEVIEVDYSGLVNGDVLTVKYQLYDGKTWGSWITAGTINFSSATPYIEIVGSVNKLYKRLKINVYASTITAASTLAVVGVSWRYTLQPRMRWRWQALLMAEGNGTIADRSGAAITADANAFSNSVLKAAKQKTPVFMFSPDYGKVKTGFNSAALSFVVLGQPPIYTDPYSEYMLCAVLNNAGVWEILRVTSVSYNGGTDETTINVAERGYYGVTAGTVNANAEFHLAYKVYITRLLRDAPVLDDNTYNEQITSGESQLQREYLLEITEV